MWGESEGEERERRRRREGGEKAREGRESSEGERQDWGVRLERRRRESRLVPTGHSAPGLPFGRRFVK